MVKIAQIRPIAIVGVVVLVGLIVLVVFRLIPNNDNPAAAEDVPGLTVQQGPSAGWEAQLVGDLAVDESTNCLVVLKAGKAVDVAWPQGWSVAARDGSIVLVNAAGEAASKVGDPVSVIGGTVSPSRANSTSCTNSDAVFAASGIK